MDGSPAGLGEVQDPPRGARRAAAPAVPLTAGGRTHTGSRGRTPIGRVPRRRCRCGEGNRPCLGGRWRRGSSRAWACSPSLSGAVESRLQVAPLEYLTGAASAGPPATPLPGTNTLARLESLRDRLALAPAALLPGREGQLLDHPGDGAVVPARLSVRPPTREQTWTTRVWDGPPGETAAGVGRTEMVAWQEADVIAAHPAGPLRLLALGGPARVGGRADEVPQLSDHALANAVARRTGAAWVAHHAKALNGMACGIGTGQPRVYHPDRVSALPTLPAQPHACALVLGWCDPREREIAVWPRCRVPSPCGGGPRADAGHQPRRAGRQPTRSPWSRRQPRQAHACFRWHLAWMLMANASACRGGRRGPSCPGVVAVRGLLEVSAVDMGLERRGGAVPMPERLPDAPPVCPTRRERGGEAVPQGVR